MPIRAAIALLAAAALAAQDRKLPDTQELEREVKRFVNVLTIAAGESADPVSFDEAVYGGAIPGMLRRLDPHSVFFDRDQFAQLQEMQRSVTKGFGSIVSVLPGRVIVLQTMPGSPSGKAGLAPGDEIVAINEIPLAGLSLDQLVELLGASRQRPVQLLVRRQGAARPLPFTLTPEEMQSPAVDRAFLLAPGAGYVRITSFDTNTAQKLQEAVESLGGKKLDSLVLDLRDNPGGVLTAAIECAALLLKPGDRILTTRGRSVGEESVDVPPEAKPWTFRVAILVNAKTASAAEILAGAIEDNDRGVIVGEPTFGKGLVQRVTPLSEETGLALTTAFYYTPAGRSIQRPLGAGMELEAATAVRERPVYKTRAGRTVRGGGGIDPEHRVLPEPTTRLRAVIEASGALPAFATEWLAKHRSEVRRDMEVSPATLDDFQLYLSQRRIRPGIADWTAELGFLRSRLKQEILNQSLGVAAGDEVEMRRDPVVRRALELLAPR